MGKARVEDGVAVEDEFGSSRRLPRHGEPQYRARASRKRREYFLGCIKSSENSVYAPESREAPLAAESAALPPANPCGRGWEREDDEHTDPYVMKSK